MWISDHVITVQFNCIRSGALQPCREARPIAKSATIQRRDHGDSELFFQVVDLAHVFFRRELVAGKLGEARVTVRSLCLDEWGWGKCRLTARFDLLFEHRTHDHGRRTGILQLPRNVDIVAKG